MTLRNAIASLPAVQRLWRMLGGRAPLVFTSSSQYWEERYATGGDSGAGSYGHLAAFKAEVLNDFVAEHGVQSVLEFGCGDGAQLARARYPRYAGVDVSRTAIAQCRERFKEDPSKRFVLAGSEELEPAELTLSLDVIYHLVEDEVFDRYMRDLFAFASRFVGVYSSNHASAGTASHVRHRRFVDWVEASAPQWRLFRKVDNAYSFQTGRAKATSFADFYFFCCGPVPSIERQQDRRPKSP